MLSQVKRAFTPIEAGSDKSIDPRVAGALIISLIAGGVIATATAVLAQDADTVSVNGAVFTAGSNPEAQGFAVKDGRFLAVGSSDAVRSTLVWARR